MLQSMGLQIVGHDGATELNWKQSCIIPGQIQLMFLVYWVMSLKAAELSKSRMGQKIESVT